MIVENLPVPFDRRVWQESNALANAGYEVSIICPVGKGYEKHREIINGIHIYRHPLPLDASGPIGYFLEYSSALFWEFVLSWKVLLTRGFDVIHACNPPDNIFVIGLFFKIFGKKFLFDHHDINPELYEAKFNRRDMFYKMMLAWERWTFWTADVSIATNESYRNIAIQRGHMRPDRVFVVRSGPDLTRLKLMPPKDEHRHGRKYLVGYVGVMGHQEGIDYLLKALRYIVKHCGRNDIHFGLVGGGTVLEEMKQLSTELEVADYLTFYGRAPDEVLLEVLNTSDVCVNSDIANEMNDKSTMNKIMEYMALGKPIVQFDLAEGKYSAQEASLYAKKNDAIDFANKIMGLLDNPKMREEMGAFGRQRVISELQWEYEVPRLLAAYDCLWNKNSK